MKKLLVGTKIICPECGELQITCIKELKLGDRILSSSFEPAPGNDKIAYGEKTNCYKCGASYGQHGKFYTERYGWY